MIHRSLEIELPALPDHLNLRVKVCCIAKVVSPVMISFFGYVEHLQVNLTFVIVREVKGFEAFISKSLSEKLG